MLLAHVWYVSHEQAPETVQLLDHHVVIAADKEEAQRVAGSSVKEPDKQYDRVDLLGVVGSDADGTPRVVMTTWWGNPNWPDEDRP